MTGPRTSFRLGIADADALLSAVLERIEWVEESARTTDDELADGLVEQPERDTLARLYQLRNRLTAARARLAGQREGRSGAAS